MCLDVNKYIMRRFWLCMYIEIFMFKLDFLLLLIKINVSIKVIKNMIKMYLKKMRNLLILYLYWYYLYKYNLSMILRILF